MWKFIKGLLISLGLLFIALAVGGVLLLRSVMEEWREEPLPREFVLDLKLRPNLEETGHGLPFARLFGADGALSLLDLVETLRDAAGDARVRGLLIDLSAGELSLAQSQELRAALIRFRASGRFVHAYSDSFEGHGALAHYLLASAAERVSMQPSGILDTRGIGMEMPFFGEALDRIGVRADVRARHEFKGAMAPLTDSRLSPALRENYGRLVESLYAQVAADIANARRLSPSSVNALINKAPLVAEEARANGLVDATGYRDEAVAMAREKAGGGDLLDFARYSRALGEEREDGTAARFAVVTVDGPIVRGERRGFAERGQATAGALATAIEEARKDKRVKAIILRIDSPGGSYVAADTMLHELKRARAGGLPIIASMSGSAASGGYFVALSADHIVAQPATVTGSIGVFSGKLVVAGFAAKHGIVEDGVAAGRNAGMYSPFRDFTPSESERLDVMLDAIYADFTAKVAEARRLGSGEIDALARGRIWSGVDAKRFGLVDALGGYAEAERLARDAAGIAAGEAVDLVPYPSAERPFDLLLEALEEGDIAEAMSRINRFVAILGYGDAVMRQFERAADAAAVEAAAPPLTLR